MKDSSDHPQRELSQGQIGSGSVNTVVRDGDTVCRPSGAWTPAVHGLLRHLEQVGFVGAPRVIGISNNETEILTYLEGEAAMRPWPQCLLVDSGIVALGTWLRNYHLAVQSFVPNPNAIWRTPGAVWLQGKIIRHGDLGPWNTIWKDDVLIGVIDWDFAEPGFPIEDVAQLAWYAVPLRPKKACEEAGIESEVDQHRRLHLLCEIYGTNPASLVDALLELQRTEIQRTEEFGKAGLTPWSYFFERGDCQSIQTDSKWLIEKRSFLVGRSY